MARDQLGSAPTPGSPSAATTAYADIGDELIGMTPWGIGVETFPRLFLAGSTAGLPMNSKQASWTTFRATESMLVGNASAVTPWSGAGSGIVGARMGLATYDPATNTNALVAQTASDVTMFSGEANVYTRAFDTAGGFPATYQLEKGGWYSGVIWVNATTMPKMFAMIFPDSDKFLGLYPPLANQTYGTGDLRYVAASNARGPVYYMRFTP